MKNRPSRQVRLGIWLFRATPADWEFVRRCNSEGNFHSVLRKGLPSILGSPFSIILPIQPSLNGGFYSREDLEL